MDEAKSRLKKQALSAFFRLFRKKNFGRFQKALLRSLLAFDESCKLLCLTGSSSEFHARVCHC
jgi:hypothetical protein